MSHVRRVKKPTRECPMTKVGCLRGCVPESMCVSAQEEQRDELLAPHAQRTAVIDKATGTTLKLPHAIRSEWRDPDDLDTRRRTPATVKAFRVRCVLEQIYLDGRCTPGGLSVVTPSDLANTSRLTDDYELGHGARPGYERPEAGTAGALGVGPGAAQLDALGRYRAAVQAVGQIGCAVLLPVVLANQEPVDLGRLRAALDLLAAHYDGEAGPERWVDGV